ncbi:hypothetical protein HDK77DRAFT_29329 [Phyllosticta capitalensis]
MANFAPPISRDGFVYHGQLFADVGNLNRHPRASIQDLTELLRPNKPTKDSQAKDQVGHWYFAQLKHYGLPTTKDKNAAKVRLLKAINERQIEVPKDVKKLEGQLKKEYDAANKKAKAELKGGGSTPVPPATTAPAKTTTKRKRTDEDAAPKKAPAKKKAASTSTRMPAMPGSSISVGSNGGININIAYQEFLGNVGDTQGAAKKKKTATAAKDTTTAKSTTTKGSASKSTSSTASGQQSTAQKSTVQKSTAQKTAVQKSTAQKSTAQKATTQKTTKAGSAAKSTASSTKKSPVKSTAVPKETSPKTKKTTKKTAGPASEPTVQRRASGMIKQESDYLNSSSAATPFDNDISQFYNHDQTLNNITGIYDIQCTIEEDFPAHCENGCRLMLCREQGTGRVWGSFSWGPFFGVIQLNPGPPHFSQDSLSLGWRAKNLDNGRLEFGRGKTGVMVFRNKSEISGQLFDLFGNFVEFFGRRRDGPANCGFSPAQFAAEWEQYPAIAYGRNQPDDRQSYESEPNHGGYYESEPDDRDSYDSELDDGDHYDSEHDHGQLYNEDGELSPTGRYEMLMRESLGGW